MSKRQVQHRPEREVVRGRELAEARKETKQLKRLVSRLQKTIRKLEEERGERVELAEASPEPLASTETTVEVITESEKRAADTCACGASNWSGFTTPSGKQIKVCKNCHRRV